MPNRRYRDELNSQAYNDVCESKSPTLPDDEEYMKCYTFWRGVAGEQHFDRYFCEADFGEDNVCCM